MQKTIQHTSLDARELTSALADGELQDAEFAQALAALRADERAQRRWHDYHLVGDVLRAGSRAAVGAHDPAFMTRLRQRLREEGARPQAVAQEMRTNAQRSANDEVWRWKLVAGLASVAIVAVLAWPLAVSRRHEGPAVALAQPGATPSQVAAQAPVAITETPVMIRDPRLDQLIAEHQQLGGTSALQMPAGFLRNATFERPAR